MKYFLMFRVEQDNTGHSPDWLLEQVIRCVASFY